MATPRIHRVWNDDTSWFHVIDIELIASQPKNKVELLDDDQLQTLFNEKLVTGYEIKMSKGQTIKLPSSKSGYFFVSLSNAIVDIKLSEILQHRNMKAGHYLWIDGKDSTSITSNTIADFVLLQLK